MNTMHQTLLNATDRAMNRTDQVPELTVYILMKEDNQKTNKIIINCNVLLRKQMTKRGRNCHTVISNRLVSINI